MAPETGLEAVGTDAEVLRATGLHVAFGPNVVLRDFSLSLRRGENLAILGRSGSGKSVFLKVITGLLVPDDGSVVLWGREVAGIREREWVPLRRRMGMVFQSGALFDSMTVYENVAFPVRERKLKNEKEIRDLVAERLQWVGLPGIEDLSPSELSGGMRRRVSLARTLAGEPEFVLYDEPTAGLDPVTARKISQLLRELDERLHTTSIVVTHDIECAYAVAGRWAFLSEGRVLADGSPESLIASKDREIQEFLRPPLSAQDLHESSTEP